MIVSPRAEELFTEALTLAPEARVAFVKNACGEDLSLFAEVESLINSANDSQAYFDQLSDRVGLATLGDDTDLAARGKTIGQWRLLRLIGRGGMGSVYLADRVDGQFEKRVALKILPIGIDNEQARSRFLNERQILARLVHDNIARLLDGGVTDEGAPYFVMDYVQGTRISVYCDENNLDIAQRLRLVLDVARGVQFAHRNLIIHRDLKPGNILVEDEGRARLLDFGIAKVLEPTANSHDLTKMAHRPVTPAYASPEMLRGEAVDVTTDVYSLGVVLYELLTGRLPLDFDGLTLAQMHAHAETAIPQAVSQFCAGANGDLDAIVAKALAKAPAERYESVESLAQDIRNYLDGLPVLAKAPSAWYRSRKFIGRHRLGVSFALFALLGLAAFAVFAGYSAVHSERQARAIALERDRVEAVKEFLIGIFDAAGPNVSGADLTAREILDAGRERINTDLSDQPELQADLLTVMSEVYSIMGLLKEWQSVLLEELAIRANTYGTQSSEYLDVLLRLAQAEDLIGDYEASRGHASEALALSMQLQDGPREADSRNQLGRLMHLKGDYAGADTEYRAALALFQNSLGDDNLKTAQVKLHLATLLDHQQHHEDALELILQVVATREKLDTREEAVPTDLYLTQGRILGKLKRFDEAIAIYERTFAANERIYGPDNSYNLYILSGLGKISEDRGEYQKAIANYKETRRLVLIHTPDSPNVGRANANVGRVYQLNNQCNLAVPAFETALKVFAKHLPDHWFMADAKWRLGKCLVQAGDYGSAEPLILDGIALLTSRWAKREDDIRNANAAAATLYTIWGKPEQAAEFVGLNE